MGLIFLLEEKYLCNDEEKDSSFYHKRTIKIAMPSMVN